VLRLGRAGAERLLNTGQVLQVHREIDGTLEIP
jgi:hypothetical protein